MLKANPKDRLTMDKILIHPFLKGRHICPQTIMISSICSFCTATGVSVSIGGIQQEVKKVSTKVDQANAELTARVEALPSHLLLAQADDASILSPSNTST